MNKINKIKLVLIVIFIVANSLFSQTKVGNNHLVIDSCSVFEIESTTKGFLPPRMNTTQRNAISNPIKGLIIFNMDNNCFEFFDGFGWFNQCSKTSSPISTTIQRFNLSSGGSAVVSSWSGTDGCNIGAGTNNSPNGITQGAVNETMIVGVPVPSSTNVKLNANTSLAGTYFVFTNEVNGVRFFARDTSISSGNRTITLRPTGTPLAPGNYVWTTSTNPSINIYGSVITTIAPLGSTYTSHFNGIIGSAHVGNTWQLATQTTGETFNNNTLCANKPISAQGCGGVSSVVTSGGVYNTVLINGQCWLQTNMKDIPNAYRNYTSTSWTNTSPNDQGYWGFYNELTTNGSAGWGVFESNLNYGALYQWCAAMDATISERSRGICPTGWHIPSDCEWMYLEHGQGMSLANQILEAMRASNNVNEGNPGTKLRVNGTNITGFTGLPTDSRNSNGVFFVNELFPKWWSSTYQTRNTIFIRGLGLDTGFTSQWAVWRNSVNNPSIAYSVRCLKD